MSWAESQASKDGCNTQPELEIGSLAHDGIVTCSLYIFPLTDLISFKVLSGTGYITVAELKLYI